MPDLKTTTYQYPTKRQLRGLSPRANYRPSDRHLSAKLVPTFAYRGYRVVSATDLHRRILGFLDRSRYFLPSSSSIVLTGLSGPRSRHTKTKLRGELYRPSNRRLSAKLVPTFVGRVCHVVSVTDHLTSKKIW
jgi:hypothetical protein